MVRSGYIKPFSSQFTILFVGVSQLVPGAIRMNQWRWEVEVEVDEKWMEGAKEAEGEYICCPAYKKICVKSFQKIARRLQIFTRFYAQDNVASFSSETTLNDGATY